MLQVKCHQYWPMGAKKGGENEMVFTEVGLKVEFISEVEASYYTKRVLRYLFHITCQKFLN